MLKTISESADSILCVDLDGTLIVGDTLLQSLSSLILSQPLFLFLLPFWVLRGKAHFKSRVAAHSVPDPSRLLYRQEVIDYLKKERAKSREILLTTGANRAIAERVAAYLGLFTDILASDDRTNLTGEKKAKAIKNYAGGRAYSYIGNSRQDVSVWRDAEGVMLVTPDSSNLKSVWQVMRLRHWAKNVLLFVPLITSHTFNDTNKLLAVLAAMVSFSLAASAGYIINDVVDAEFDSRDPDKSFRPIANGSLKPGAALMIALLLLAAATAIAGIFLPRLFTISLFIYIAATWTYSLYIKRIAIIDVLLLAGLHTLRVIAGGLTVGITVSPWLLAFSLFMFLSLAFVKRYSELTRAKSTGSDLFSGRGYSMEDLQILGCSGIASGYMAVVVFALYINNSPDVPLLYGRPQILWLVCPLLLYWIQRVWLLTYRGAGISDPVVFALQDSVSYRVGAGIALLLWLAG